MDGTLLRSNEDASFDLNAVFADVDYSALFGTASQHANSHLGTAGPLDLSFAALAPQIHGLDGTELSSNTETLGLLEALQQPPPSSFDYHDIPCPTFTSPAPSTAGGESGITALDAHQDVHQPLIHLVGSSDRSLYTSTMQTHTPLPCTLDQLDKALREPFPTMSEEVFKHLFGYEHAPITSSTTSPPTLRRQTHSELQAGDRLQQPASLSHELSGCSPVAIPSNTHGGDLPATKYQPYSVPSTHLGCVTTQYPFNSLSSVPEGRTSCHPTASHFLPSTRPPTSVDHHEVYYPINPGAPRHLSSSSHRSSHPPIVSTPKPTRGDKGKRKREGEIDVMQNKQQKLTFTVSGTPRDTECPRCGKYFSASGLGKHLASCRSTIGRQKFAFVPASWRKSEVQATCPPPRRKGIMAYTFNQKSLEPEVDNFLRSISGLVPSGSWSGASRNAEIVAFLKTGRYEVQDGATACCWCEKADWDDQSYYAGLASHGPICLVRLRAFQAAGYGEATADSATNLKKQSSEPSYHTSISRISSTTPSLVNSRASSIAACSRSVSVTPTPITPCDSSDTTKPFLDINESKEGKASKENVPSHPATNDNDEEEEDEWEEVVIPPRVSHQTPAASPAIKRSTQADPVGQTCAEEPTTTTVIGPPFSTIEAHPPILKLGARSASRRESDDHHSNRALLDDDSHNHNPDSNSDDDDHDN